MIRILFEPRDCWIGVYWTRDLLPLGFSTHESFGETWNWRVFICLVPCFPILIAWERPAPAASTENGA